VEGPGEAARLRRIEAEELRRRLAGEKPPLLLDVRRRAAFRELPGIPSAIPFALDREPLRLPDLPRGQPIVAYCL
jgi:rhodanese-related sulfurtransferase